VEAKAYVPPPPLLLLTNSVVLSINHTKKFICIALQDQIGNPNTKDETLFFFFSKLIFFQKIKKEKISKTHPRT
jgi:hypothetical protein